jgi:peroxiredoxin
MRFFSALLLFLLAILPASLGAVEVGEKAPGFELQSTRGGSVRLADFAGQKEVVLLFYPMDFTPT